MRTPVALVVGERFKSRPSKQPRNQRGFLISGLLRKILETMNPETAASPITTPETHLEKPVFVTPDAVVWEEFDGQKIAVTALIRGGTGEVVQYHRAEWACFILGAKVREFDLAEDEPEIGEVPPEAYLSGGLIEIDQPEAAEGYWAETESLQWRGADHGRLPPLVALLVRVETDEGQVTMSLRDWYTGLTPRQQENFNLYQLHR